MAVDTEFLRRKYKEERDKRIRSDGNEQYIEITEGFGHYQDDPYTPLVEREPVLRDAEVVIIGGGFAGLTAGARLRDVGVEDITIIEGGGDVGGVWYWNRYPGAMCDTAAMVYLPLLEETNYLPTQKYVLAPEIFAHAQRIARQYELYDQALFSTQVKGVRWDDANQRWLVTTNRGDQLRARFLIAGTGPLHRPKLPGIPGIQEFKGESFHTSRWEYSVTGGSPLEPMNKLATKRVGIIGTGATAIQCIPHLGRDAQELFVFQRTPSSVDFRNNHPLSPENVGELSPGWQEEWLLNFCTLQNMGFADVDYVKDGWTDISKRIRDRVIEEAKGNFTPEIMRSAYEACDDEKMEEIRARVDDVVSDQDTAQGLKAWYRQLCKRPCFHDEYLDTYNRSSVHLVDTNGQGVERIDATGVWVQGVHYELDVLIFASGFEVGTELSRRTGFEIVGRNDLTLSEKWSEGMETLHGMHVVDFPNLFLMQPSQAANLISNITHNHVESSRNLASVIDHVKRSGATLVEPDAEAVDAWVAQYAMATGTVMNSPDCTPGYYNNEGKGPDARQLRTMGNYPTGSIGYFAYSKAWRESGEFTGLHFS
jgi:cation diffusion facilitator CzcD-associated flavoprotein CzcO